MTEHDWRNQNGVPSLVKRRSGAGGLFYNFEDGFVMTCPACERPILIRNWRSANNTFAAGHLGFTLWGANLTALAEQPSIAPANNIRHLIGDAASVDSARKAAPGDTT